MVTVPVQEVQLEARDGSVTIFDTTPGPSNANLTRARDPLDPESAGGGRGSDGLWDGFTGAGYLDMGGNAGDAFAFDVDAPEAGIYTLTFRHAHPGNRPMNVLVDGQPARQIPFASTGAFDNWAETSIELTLPAGSSTIRLANVGNTGPNLDRVVITREVADDTTADDGDDLALVAVAAADPAAVAFAVSGLDPDIETTTISVNGGPPQTVSLDGQGRFIADLSAFAGTVEVTLTVQDEVPNSAQASTVVTVAPGGGDPVNLFFDGTDFINLNPGSTIIREEGDPSTHEQNSNHDQDGDGLNDNHDGTSYVDFGGGIGDKVSLTVNVAEDGLYDFVMRAANGNATQLRPIQIQANGEIVEIADTRTPSLSTWEDFHFRMHLEAGANTVIFRQTSVAGGPNIDSVTVTSAFDPEYAAINGSGRIELENSQSQARTLADDEVEFYFTVTAGGVYALDLAANSGASPGGSTNYVLTADGGQRILLETTAFPGQGTVGEVTAWAALDAGLEYKLSIETIAPGAEDIDYLDVRSVGSQTSDVAVQSLDPGYFDDRLHFSWLEDPVARGESPREYKDTAIVRISNTGTSALQILDVDIDNFYSIVSPNVVGTSIAPGGFRDISVAFNGETDAPNSFPAANKRTVYQGELVVTTNDADSPLASIDLAAIWQKEAENGNEPNVNDIWRTFGFGTQVPISGLNNNGVYEKVNDLEVLAPLWRLADGVTEARITQIAAYHSPDRGPVLIHAPDAKGQSVSLFNGNASWSQSVLPLTNGGGFATTTITAAKVPNAWAGDDVFSFLVAGYSTNPKLNPKGPVDLPGDIQQGHYLRIFQALDGDGKVIPNGYLAAQDFAGINYDYNDNMLLIEGLTPVDPLV